MSTQKYTAVMTSLYKREGKLFEQFLKPKNWGWGEGNRYTDALEIIYSKE